MVIVSGPTTVRHITMRIPTQWIPIRESMDVKWTCQVPMVYPDPFKLLLGAGFFSRSNMGPLFRTECNIEERKEIYSTENLKRALGC